jgi:SNF2 family DNA or RNA helicase
LSGTHEIQKHIEEEGQDLKVLVYQGSNRKKAFKKKEQYDIILTSFTVVRMETVKTKEKSLPTKFEPTSIFNEKFERVVLDEAHFIRNKGTKTTKVITRIYTELRFRLYWKYVRNIAG